MERMSIRPTTDPLDGGTILTRARDIAPVLREEADENERRRRLTPRAVDALRSTGVFRMTMPRAWGGPEVDPATQIQIVEELARADGSSGWCASIGAGGGYVTAALDETVGKSLYADLDAISAGWVMPGGRLVPSGSDRFRLSGRWQFGSGCNHADVVLSGAVVAEDGRPATTTDGRPDTRLVVLPADRFTVVDTWHTTGLAGSGSHDYTTHDTDVPADHTFRWDDGRRAGALYSWPGLFAVNLVGVALGIGRAALDTAEAILADKVVVPEMRPARDEPRVRVALSRAHALVGSARSYVFDVVGDFWATLLAGDEPSRRQRAELAGTYFHAVRGCRDAVETLADSVGTAALFRSCPLERHRRDLTTISQHVTAQPRLLELVGGLWLGGTDLDHPLIDQRFF
jgi:alkylation response protein AidB-like acyl-CoA dehydrogenase